MTIFEKPDATTLVIKRRIAAAKDDVFAAWVEPEILARWFGGKPDAHCIVHQADVRVGGRYDFEIVPDDGGETHRVSGTYQDVIPGQRLVFSWAWQSTPDRQSLVTIDLSAGGENTTLLTLTHARFFDSAARDRHAGGWTRSLDAIKRYFAAASRNR